MSDRELREELRAAFLAGYTRCMTRLRGVAGSERPAELAFEAWWAQRDSERAAAAEAIVDPPACPECGAMAMAASIGVMTVVAEGMAPVRSQPSPEGVRVECANGHWYTLDGAPAGPPRDFTVREGPT